MDSGGAVQSKGMRLIPVGRLRPVSTISPNVDAGTVLSTGGSIFKVFQSMLRPNPDLDLLTEGGLGPSRQ